MSQQWYCTRDGKSKSGPHSFTELRSRALRGDTLPTDMVLMDGTSKWVPANTIKGLFAPPAPGETSNGASRPKLELVPGNNTKIELLPIANPVAMPIGHGGASPTATAPSRGHGQAAAWLRHANTAANSVAAALAIAAVTLAFLSSSNDGHASGIAVTAIIIGGAGALLALALVCIGLKDGNGRAFIEAGLAAMFMSVTAVLFALGSASMGRQIRDLRDVAAQADEVERERRRAETARREAKLAKDEAEKALDEALFEPKAVAKKNAERAKELDGKSEQLKEEQVKVAMDREEAETEAKAKRAEAKKMLDMAFETMQDSVKMAAVRTTELLRKEADLEKRIAMVSAREKQLEIDLKVPQMLKDEATKLKAESKAELEKADAANAAAKKALDLATTKEDEASRYYKKAIGEIKDTLKPKGNKAALDTVERIGPFPASANVRMHEVSHDLCEIAVKDSALRLDAINAIFKIEPKLGPIASMLVKPPDATDFNKYAQTVKDLEEFGAAGIPLAAGILASKTLKAQNNYGYWTVFDSLTGLLATAAIQGDDRALVLLCKTPKSDFAVVLGKHSDGHNFRVANNQPLPSNAPMGWLSAKKTVGERLFNVCKELPTARTRKHVTDFYVDLLKDDKMTLRKLNDEYQILAAKALASFGADGSPALTQLRSMRTANSAEVRDAVAEAIEKIEKAK